MSTPVAPPREGNGDAPASDEMHWIAAERSPEFQELIRRKRAFVVPATIFFLTWYLGFILLAGYAESFMGKSIYQGFTVGYALALSQFVMVWVLGAWYVRKASREWDPLREEAIQRALMYFRRPAGQEPEDLYGDSSPMGISRPEPARERESEREEVRR